MVDNNLLKFSCKEYFLKAGLCTLASGDVVGAKVDSNACVINRVTFDCLFNRGY